MQINVTGIGGLILLALDIWALISVIGSAETTGQEGDLGAGDPVPAAARLHRLADLRPARGRPERGSAGDEALDLPRLRRDAAFRERRLPALRRAARLPARGHRPDLGRAAARRRRGGGRRARRSAGGTAPTPRPRSATGWCRRTRRRRSASPAGSTAPSPTSRCRENVELWRAIEAAKRRLRLCAAALRPAARLLARRPRRAGSPSTSSPTPRTSAVDDRPRRRR